MRLPISAPLSTLLLALALPAAAQPTVNTNVVNTPAVRDVESTVRNAFSVLLCQPSPAVGCPPQTPTGFTVPVGKRAVIEYVSGFCATPNKAASVAINLVFGGAYLQHFVPSHVLGVVNGLYEVMLGASTRIYADPGEVFLAANTGSGCKYAVSGVMVNL